MHAVQATLLSNKFAYKQIPDLIKKISKAVKNGQKQICVPSLNDASKKWVLENKYMLEKSSVSDFFGYKISWP